MKHVAIAVSWVIVVYLSGAFVTMQLNVADWDSHGRLFALVFVGLGMCFTYAELERQDKESEK